MDVDIDDDDDGFNLLQPSLFQQIKNILDQYPDDGQILKVNSILHKTGGLGMHGGL